MYTGPGFENEIIGKIEKDGVVYILNSTNDLIWHSVKCCKSSITTNSRPKIMQNNSNNEIEGWIPTSKLDFTTKRNLYDDFDRSNIIKQNAIDATERFTTQTIGLRSLPNIASHCQAILDP